MAYYTTNPQHCGMSPKITVGFIGLFGMKHRSKIKCYKDYDFDPYSDFDSDRPPPRPSNPGPTSNSTSSRTTSRNPPPPPLPPRHTPIHKPTHTHTFPSERPTKPPTDPDLDVRPPPYPATPYYPRKPVFKAGAQVFPPDKKDIRYANDAARHAGYADFPRFLVEHGMHVTVGGNVEVGRGMLRGLGYAV